MSREHSDDVRVGERNDDDLLLIVPTDAVPLTAEYALVMTVNGEGELLPLLLHHSFVDGNTLVPGINAPHEHLGPLPESDQQIVDAMCGARRKDGKPCRNWVGCRWHRKAVQS